MEDAGERTITAWLPDPPLPVIYHLVVLYHGLDTVVVVQLSEIRLVGSILTAFPNTSVQLIWYKTAAIHS